MYLSQLTRGTLKEGNFNIIIILLALMLAFLLVLTCTFDELNVTIMTGMLQVNMLWIALLSANVA